MEKQKTKTKTVVRQNPRSDSGLNGDGLVIQDYMKKYSYVREGSFSPSGHLPEVSFRGPPSSLVAANLMGW